MDTISNDAGLSRKDMLKKWRAEKGIGMALNSKSDNSSDANEKGKAKEGKHAGVLASRPGAANGVKRPASRANKRVVKRRPFQVDAVVVREASERRVAPGTPINMLKKRLKRAEAVAEPAAQLTQTARLGNADGGHGKGKSKAVASRGQSHSVYGYQNGVSHSLDAARTKQVSEYLKSQISQANLLLEVAGVDAARTLLADLLSCTGDGRGVGELALYWAARAKLEEDAGKFSAARRTLDEGQAHISMPTQQRVMEKVLAAFESRMNDRAEADIANLLEESVESGINASNSNSNSPTSSTPFRYDPNDLSLEDDGGGSTVGSAIKNLNFSRIACAEDSGDSASREDQEDEAVADSADKKSRADGTGLAEIDGVERSGGSDALSGVVYSDDDSDLSISDIDEAVLARAKAFDKGEEARNKRIEKAKKAKGDTCEYFDDESELALYFGKATVASPLQPEEERQRKSGASGPQGDVAAAMPPPDSRPSRKRKGTPHPKKPTPDGSDGKDGDDTHSPGGSFIAQVESRGKDGKRTLTPVRRSRRFSGAAKEPTPSHLREEMEAML